MYVLKCYKLNKTIWIKLCFTKQAKLKEKKKVLLDQHNEAKILKIETDKKQIKVSEMLASKFNQEQVGIYNNWKFFDMLSITFFKTRLFSIL